MNFENVQFETKWRILPIVKSQLKPCDLCSFGYYGR